MRWLGIFAALAAAAALGYLLFGGGTSAAPATRAARETANRRAAIHAVDRTLATVELPPGAREEPHFPPRVRHSIAKSEFEPLETRRLVRGHRDWIVPGSPAATLRWFAAHREPGWISKWPARTDRRGVRGVSLRWRPPVDGVLRKERAFIVHHYGPKHTALRVEGQAVWIKPRPPDETIPAGAHFMAVSVSRSGAGHPRSTSTTDQAKIAGVIRLIDTREVNQDCDRGCPPSPMRAANFPIVVNATFRARSGTPALAVASFGIPVGCEGISLVIDGRGWPSLEGAGWLARRLRPMIAKEISPKNLAAILDSEAASCPISRRRRTVRGRAGGAGRRGDRRSSNDSSSGR
jgi:hypothetical protein